MAWLHIILSNTWIQSDSVSHLAPQGPEDLAFFVSTGDRVQLDDRESSAANINSWSQQHGEPQFVALDDYWVNPVNVAYLMDAFDGTTFIFFPTSSELPFWRRQVHSPVDAVSSALTASLTAAGSHRGFASIDRYRINPSCVESITAIDDSDTKITFVGLSFGHSITVPFTPQVTVSTLAGETSIEATAKAKGIRNPASQK